MKVGFFIEEKKGGAGHTDHPVQYQGKLLQERDVFIYLLKVVSVILFVTY